LLIISPNNLHIATTAVTLPVLEFSIAISSALIVSTSEALVRIGLN
jgi:hypothetical protein